jgi:pilus assembly protein Flp/PilA
MSPSEIIKARIELPCTIRFYSKGLGYTSGITEELSRESLVVIAFSVVHADWLSKPSEIAVDIELPHWREFHPRILECAATVTGLHPADSGLRISARVNRMCIKDRETGSVVPEHDVVPVGFRSFAAIGRSRNADLVIRKNHLTQNTQKGKNSMSFAKKLFTEEDGQDMVEYGLVIALVVLAAGAVMTAFKGSISTAFSTLGTSVTTSL